MKKKKLGVFNTPYDGGRWVTDGGWWVTDGGWWVATKHQRVDAIVKKKRVSVLMAPPAFLHCACRTPVRVSDTPNGIVPPPHSFCGVICIAFPDG